MHTMIRRNLVIAATASALWVGLIFCSACARNLPKLDGAEATAPESGTFWVPPRSSEKIKGATAAPSPVPPDLALDQHRWGLPEVVDLALRNNPATRASWAEARAAAARYGSERGAYWPTADLGGNLNRAKSTASPTSPFLPVPVTTYGASLTVEYLLFDFGGRSGAVEAARQALLAADWSHNAVLQDVILQVESAYFRYMAAKALLSAQQASFEDARAQLDAADERHSVGVATIADVLQARTAVSRAQLALDDTRGRIQTARGALAASMGLPANIPYDIGDVPENPELKKVTESVEDLIGKAVAARPDLAAARAEAESAGAHVREVQAKGWPSLTTSGSVARTAYDGYGHRSDSYSAGLFLRIPLFTGFSQTYDVMEAKAQADAAGSRMQSLEQRVIYEVWDSYFSLHTAAQRVRTVGDLLASAEQSHEVALARYKEGLGSILDLLAADSALAEARAQRVSAWLDWYTSLARLARDTGLLGLHGENPLVGESSDKSEVKSEK